MKVQLRPHQIEFKSKIRESLAHNKWVICCAATGFGKTITFVDIVHDALNKKRTVLILTESRKIYDQISSEFPSFLMIAKGKKYNFIKKGGVNIAMAQTLRRRSNLIQQFKELGNELLVIVDEAHIGTTASVVRELRHSGNYGLGFTATPDGTKSKHIPELYESIVIGSQPYELIQLGYLSKYYHFEKQSVDISNLRMKGGEFTEESQEEAFDAKGLFGGFIEDIKKQTFKKCMIFVSSIKSAEHHALELRNVGYRVAVVHSGNKESQDDLKHYEDLKSGIDICVSVNMVTAGYDFPSMDLGIIRRSTTSLALYNQMVGRMARISPNKERFTILDYGGNASRHGAWNSFIDWSELFKGKPPKTNLEMIGGIRLCEECGYAMEQAIRKCPECGHEKAVEQIEEVDGVLVDVLAKIKAIEGKRLSELNHLELAYYAKFSGKIQLCNRVASSDPDKLEGYRKAMGYRKGWQNYQKLGRSYHDSVI